MPISPHTRYRPLYSKIIWLCIALLFFTLANSGTTVIWPLYVKEFISRDAWIGVLSATLSVFYVLCYFFTIPIIEKYKKAKLAMFSFIGIILLRFFYYFNYSLFLLVLVMLFSRILFVFHKTTLGTIIRDESRLKDIGKVEGLKYAIVNIGWLIAPLFAGFIAEYLSVRSYYLISVILFTIGILFFSKVRIKKKFVDGLDSNFIKNVRDFFSYKDLIKAYIANIGLSAWWGIVYIYGPLLIIENGLDKRWVGFFLFLVCVPLIILDYPIGRLLGKVKCRKFYFFGYAIISVCAFLIFLVKSIYIKIALISLASFGAALIEPIRESYFFKLVPKKKEEKYYGPFLTSENIGNSVGTFLASSILFITSSYSKIFILSSFLMFFFAIFSLLLKKF